MLNKTKKIYIFILLLVTIIVISFMFIMNLSETTDTIDEELSQQNNLDYDNTTKDVKSSNTYYLHKSSLETPEQNKCYIAQSITLESLKDSNKKYIQDEIRILT